MKLFTVTWRFILFNNYRPLGTLGCPEEGVSVILEDNGQKDPKSYKNLAADLGPVRFLFFSSYTGFTNSSNLLNV